MFHVWILTFLIALPVLGSEFNHIKLSPQFEQYINQTKMQSLKTMGAKQNAQPMQAKIHQMLGSMSAKSTSFDSPFPQDGEESPLYQQIRQHLEASHEQLGLQQVAQLDFLNRQFNLGTENFSGFSWQKPFGVAHVWADRQVTPNLFTGGWLVQDTFTFDIEATTFLESASKAGLVDMSSVDIGAFAGITFRRVYTYYHYANSFQEGIRADFSKLFLPFLRMYPGAISRMGHEEIVKREDQWTARVGAMISTPPLYNFSLSGGVLAEYAFEQMVSVQGFRPQDAESEKVRLNLKSKKSISAGATLSLQLDFFKLLKLTILSADLVYEYASAKEFTLGMKTSDWEHVQKDPREKSEINRILRGYGSVKILEPYVVRLDESTSDSLQTRGSLLVWGKLNKSKTEQIRIISENVVKVFYKSYAQSMKVVQNIFSRLFSAVIYKVLKLPVGTKNAALYNRQVTLEYEAIHPQAGDPNTARVESSEQFSFVLNQSYEASRTHRWIDTPYKNDVIWFIDSFTTLPKDYKTIVRREELIGPIVVESNLRIEKAGFDYFTKLSENDIFRTIALACDSEFVNEWANPSDRKKLFNDWENDEFCVKNIGEPYLKFKKDFIENGFKPSIAKFKKFITKYFKEAQHLKDVYDLFGAQNTFLHGKMMATTAQGNPFQTSFSSGQFRGLGVIDNYKRSTGSRNPASIIGE